MVTGGGHTRACHARPSNHWLPRFLSRFWFADVTRHSRVPSALTKYGASLFRPVVASANQNAATTSTRYARPRRDHGTIFWVNPRRARFREASVRLATQEAWLCPCWWNECTWFGALWGGLEAILAQPGTKGGKNETPPLEKRVDRYALWLHTSVRNCE